MTDAGRPGDQAVVVDFPVGLVWALRGRPRVALSFVIERRKILEIDLVADRDHLRQLGVAILDL